MSSFNKVILVGNLVRDVEIRYTPKGVAVAKLTLAINHKWKTESGEQKEEVTFVEVDAFARAAETLGQYTKKGSPLLVEGRLRLQQWEDKQTQQKRTKLSVVLEGFQFLGSGQSGDGAARQQPRQNAPQAKRGQSAAPRDDGYQSDAPPEDDVPF